MFPLLADLLQRSVGGELTFQSNYGNIINYEWFSSSCLCIGFESGHVVVMATSRGSEASEEVPASDSTQCALMSR